MSRLTKGLALACVIMIGCAQEADEGEEAVEDTTAMATEPTLADFAGTWTVNATTETGQAVPTYELVAMGEPSGWEMRFPDRDPIEVRVVELAGDSLVVEAGPYESVLRPGVQVSTRTVYRLEGDRLVGATTAHYDTAEADSVVTVRSEGTRAP